MTIIEGRGFHTVYLENPLIILGSKIPHPTNISLLVNCPGKSHNCNIQFTLTEILCTAQRHISSGQTVRTFLFFFVFMI